MSRCRIIFSGSGGQGVITASIILAEAAVIQEELNAVQSQAYGPEARGGATRADVIIDDQPIRFPKVNQPNILICLTQEAYNKFCGIIRPGGLLLIDTHFVKYPQRKVDARQFSLDMYRTVMDEIGRPIVFNICVLGAMLGLNPVVRPSSVLEVLKSKIPSDFVEMNQKALDIGARLAENYPR
ncbi:MAG: 2-oxoacid:acceptor oxidoreductase family protein [Deltaproteobacteria bacterium]|nr:2-oxoacid:acceptor oxidoreductase family protein [Deltaproteobacteria bacterium]